MSHPADASPRRRRLDDLLEGRSDVLLLIDPTTRQIRGVDRRGALGYSAREILALRLDDLLPICETLRLDEAMRDLAGETRRSHVETSCRIKEGAEIPVEVELAAADGETEKADVLVTLRDPSRQAGAEREARRANAFLDAVIESLPDMIFVKDAETLRVERFNRAGEELLGIPRGEILGKRLSELEPSSPVEALGGQDLETILGRDLVDIPESEIETRQGPRWIRTRKVPIRDEKGVAKYVLGILEDITERKRAEERARVLERELESLLRYAHEAVITWDADGRVVLWNPAAENFYGIPAQRAIGSPIESLLPEKGRFPFREALGKLLSGEQTLITGVQRLRNGREIEESLFLLPAASDRPVRVASIARDLSEIARLRRVNEILAGPAEGPARVSSSAMKEVLESAEIAAQDPFATVLLLGETGVGKGWLARQIHAKSPRARKPFFELNCAGLGRELLESELFGHLRGAFTNAVTHKQGLVEVAEGGTLFLDEIGTISQEVQSKLLGFLDDRTFRAVGGIRKVTADVRILAATNLDLRQAADQGEFRQDLYFRLNVIPIRVPPLRERRDEIPDLASTIVEELGKRAGRPEVALGRGVIQVLQRQDWPGNVRELRNALERALILSHGRTIEVQHLPSEFQQVQPPRAAPLRLKNAEKTHILRVLAQNDGNRSAAAKILGVSRSTLKRKLREWRVGD